jgi:Tol biopolymer transport system component
MKRRLTLSVALSLGCTASEAPRVAAPPAIVFDWLRNGNRDIYRAALDGKDTVRLTSDPGDDQHPTERAGTVVFTSYRDGHAQLYAVAATGGGTARRLTNTAFNETQPALSPDGTKIAYLTDSSGVPKLWLCAADGSGRRPLTAEFGFAGSVEASPSWAPGSDRLVFVSTAGGTAGLYVVAIAGGGPTPLVADANAAVEPAWRPDGSVVAFASDRAGVTNIFTVDVVTLQIRQLTTDTATAGQPAWLADGRLVYTSWKDGAPRLRWRDPAVPDSAVNIDLGAGALQHSAAVF